MNHSWKFSHYLISAVIIIAAILTLLCTWSPLLFNIINNIYSPPQYNGFEVPTRVVGVNYPITSLVWLGIFFVISIIILILWARRRRATSALFWMNGISVAIIISHLVMWIIWLIPLLVPNLAL